MRVFLTGGTGLIGSHVAERLRLGGHDVVALARPEADTEFLEGIGCAVARGDVRDTPDVLARALEGCNALVHAAALVYARESWPRVRAVNVEGTAHVLTAAAQAGVTNTLHVSSVAVYGRARGPVDEDTPTDTALSPSDLYARSKREAEAAARHAADEGRLRLTVLRPSAVYGERDRLFAPRVARLVRMPVVPVVGSGGNGLPVVYAGNVAAAVERCLERPADVPVRVYDVGMDHPITQIELLAGMARALRVEPRIVRVPAGLAQRAAELGERLGLTVPGAADLSLSRFTRLTIENNPYPSRRIRQELDWHPPFGHDEALLRTAEWLGSQAGSARAA